MTEQPVRAPFALAQEPPLSPPAANPAAGSPAPVAPVPAVEPLRSVAPPPEPAPAPTPVAPAPDPASGRASVPLESLLLRFRMITPDQLAEAMKDEAVSGTPVAQTVVARGWVSEEDVARLTRPSADAPPSPAPVAPEPDSHPPVVAAAAPTPSPAHSPAPPSPQPAPVLAPAPSPEPAPPPAPEPVANADRTAEKATPPAVTFQVLAHLTTRERVEIARCADAADAKAAAAAAMRQVADASTEWPLLAGRYVRPESIVYIDVAALLA